MRTVLYEILLLIDNLNTSDKVFILNGGCGEEGKIAERQRERESVWEAADCGKGELVSVIKWAIRRNKCDKIMWD